METKLIVKSPFMMEGAIVAELTSACMELCRLHRHGGLIRSHDNTIRVRKGSYRCPYCNNALSVCSAEPKQPPLPIWHQDLEHYLELVGSHGLPEEDRPRLCPKCRQCKHPPHRHSHYERRVINYNIDSASLFPLIFVGQPELRKLLWLKKYEATVQHIGMQYHLCGMSKEETSSYIRHHMTVSRTEKPVFAESALSWIFAASQGLPRLVNQICTQILLDAAPVIWK